MTLALRPVGARNWHAVAALEVDEAQRDFVAAPSYYLALCCYGESGWKPLAIEVAGEVVGFLMWALDPEDGACWLGGLLIDRRHQRRGHGRRALARALELLGKQGFERFALSYQPGNAAARALYASLGFAESGEREGDEVVARLRR